MPTLQSILTKISDLKSKVISDSISPHYLGSILEQMLGFGWWTDEAGLFSIEALKVKSFLEVPELVFDRYTAIDADTWLTEHDVVSDVTDNGDGTYTLKFHEPYSGYFTAQIEHNILKGVYNDIIDSTDAGGPPYSVSEPTVVTSWMNVVSVDSVSNEAVVTLYPDPECPGGKNAIPCRNMKVMRTGNTGDSSVERYARRQQVFMMSGTDGRIVKFAHVTKPSVDDSMIMASMGTLPEFLADMDPRIKPGDDGIVADTVVARRIITIDSLGRPVSTVVDRGSWMPGESYFDGTLPNDNGIYERSLVWHNGHGWLCNSGGVSGPVDYPSWRSAIWTHAIGDAALRLSFTEADSIVDIANPECTLSLEAWYMGENVTQSPSIYYDWSRKSVRDGKEDTASDGIWNSSHRNSGSTLTLDGADMNFQFTTAPESLCFSVIAYLHDPSNPNLNTDTAEFYMI